MDSLEEKINDKFTTLAKITSQVSFSAKKLHRRLSSVDRILHDLVNIERNHVHKIKVIEVLNTINKVDNFLTEIQLHSSYVLTIITLSTLGKIHPELIPYPAFLHLVTECAQHFRLQPILPVTPDTFPRYLSFAQVHKNIAPFNVLISIPFSDGSSLTAYNFIPFPTVVSQGHRYVLKTDEHLLLIQKSSYYVFNSLNDCIMDNSLLLCPYIVPMLNSPSDYCLSQLILGLTPTLCSFSQLPTTEIYYHQIDGTWLISILNETLGKLECSGHTRNGPSYQKFSGIIVLPPGCTFSTGTLSLFSPQVSRSSLQDTGFPIFLPMLNVTNSSSLISTDEAILADLKTSMSNYAPVPGQPPVTMAQSS